MPLKRRIVAWVPTALLIVAGVLFTLGVVGPTAYFLVVTAIIFFLLGKASVLIPDANRDRRKAIAHMEGFIAWMHEGLEQGAVPESERESAERALSSAIEALALIEASAPPWTRWRERRARERAQR